jgi:hypothetical protein
MPFSAKKFLVVQIGIGCISACTCLLLYLLLFIWGCVIQKIKVTETCAGPHYMQVKPFIQCDVFINAFMFIVTLFGGLCALFEDVTKLDLSDLENKIYSVVNFCHCSSVCVRLFIQIAGFVVMIVLCGMNSFII